MSKDQGGSGADKFNGKAPPKSASKQARSGKPAKSPRSPKSNKPEPTGVIAEAFAFYYALGPDDRTLKKVAEKFERSLQTIKSWSSRYGWIAQVHKMDREAFERVKKQLVRDKAALTKQRLRMVDNLIERFETMINLPKMRKASIITDIDDLDKAVKLERLLLSEPTVITDQVTRVYTSVPRPPGEPINREETEE